MLSKVILVPTCVIKGQKPGTSGLRKPTKTFMGQNYTENFIEAYLHTQDEQILTSATLVVGGDGRYFMKEAIEKIIKIAAGNSVKKLLIGQNGILSTPAVSCLIRKHGALGGIVLTASHNPGGINADFGIKYNVSNGGPAPDNVTEAIYTNTLNLTHYHFVEDIEVDLSQIGTHIFKIEGRDDFEVEIIDSVTDYLELMKEIFDFNELKTFLPTFPIVINSMNGVTGPYVKRIFGEELKSEKTSIVNFVPLNDFGGLHPDPNLTYAKDLVEEMKKGTHQFGTAYDGDGDRNMILGKNGLFLNPCDTLAILASNIHLLPFYKDNCYGFARSMPTSSAVDKVGEKLGLPVYQVPTGWKYFGNLMDSNKITLCGEESFGTGSNHIREKDGIWTTLAFLSVLAKRKMSVEQILEEHWGTFGRNYYTRLDYEDVDLTAANDTLKALESNLPSLIEQNSILDFFDNFSYTDPVDNSFSQRQGLRLHFKNGSRIVWRMSGTGSSNATIRVYIEKFENDFLKEPQEVLQSLVEYSTQIAELKKWIGRETPTVVT